MGKATLNSIVITALVFSFFVSVMQAESPYEVAWSRQFGTADSEEIYSVAVGGLGDIFVTGYTYGDLGGPNAGGSDLFLVKYSRSGELQWKTQLGTRWIESSYSVSADAHGNSYISGYTPGDLGGVNNGDYDGFVAKYDPAGNIMWSKLLGTSEEDQARSVAVDGQGNVFVGGDTYGNLGGTSAGYQDGFLAKYDSSGNLLWTEQFGTSSYDDVYSVSVDGLGNSFVTGSTPGDLGGVNLGSDDVYLAKYDPAGNQLWIRQFGTAGFERPDVVGVDRYGNAYVNSYAMDEICLTKYSPTGGLVWHKQLGVRSYDDTPTTMAVDSDGNAYIAGYHEPFGGGYDPYIVKYDSDGNFLWSQAFPDVEFNYLSYMATDDNGNLFYTGNTYGDIGGVNAGWADGYLVKFVDGDKCPMVWRGDFNCDGEVGLLDLDILGRNWRADWLIGYEGDADGDGVVGLLDLNVLGGNWRTTATPEPGMIGLVVVGGLVFMWRR